METWDLLNLTIDQINHYLQNNQTYFDNERIEKIYDLEKCIREAKDIKINFEANYFIRVEDSKNECTYRKNLSIPSKFNRILKIQRFNYFGIFLPHMKICM